jgi:hypothetical protein
VVFKGRLYNNSAQIGSGIYSQTTSQNNYTKFQIPINYTSSLTPDSIMFAIYAGNPGYYIPGNIFHVDDLEFIYAIPVGIEEYFDKERFLIFPNPVNETLNIENTKEKGNLIVNIFTINGKNIKNLELDNHNMIDVSNFASGTYLYQIIEEGKIIDAGKFIKK